MQEDFLGNGPETLNKGTISKIGEFGKQGIKT
jgi:hypothetical protein